MTGEQDSQSRFGRLRSVIGRVPLLTTCIAVYYVLLVLFGIIIVDMADPLHGAFTILFLTHFFIVAAPSVYGPATILILVAVPVAIALCAVWLKGWWRVMSVMALIIGTHMFSFLCAAQLHG